jgi:hypothetical protein
MSSDDQLFDRLGDALATRGAWIYEPSTSPGGPPSWCLSSDGEIRLSVTVIGGAITVYLAELDREVAIADEAALLTWVDSNAAGYL